MNKSIRKLGLIALLGMAVFKPSQRLAAQDIQSSAIQQIESLNAEKEARTMVQKKLDSQLWYALKMARGQVITPLVKTLQVSLEKNAAGKLHVELYAKVSKTLLADLEKLGMEIETSLEKYNSISGYAPVLAMENIAALADVQVVKQLHKPINSSQQAEMRLPEKPSKSDRFRAAGKALRSALKPGISNISRISVGAVTSQADSTHKASMARKAFNVNGSGVKIGVISDSYNFKGGASTDVAAGELPGTNNPLGYTTPVIVRSDDILGPATDEGRAMLQLVHDIAPGAQLYFATARYTQSNYASAIIDLKNQGCTIIVDDISYLDEAVFQDGPVARAINAVTASGVLYFSSAGNSGNKNDNTSGTWEGDFTDGGISTTPPISGGTLHSFGATKYNTLTKVGLSYIILNWSDCLGKSSNDYDLYALDPTGSTVTATATNIQDGNDDPIELFAQPVVNSRIVIFKKTSAAARALHLQTVRGLLSTSTSGVIFGHSGAEKAVSVAATSALSVYPNIFSSANMVETFSSDGLRKIFYNPDSTAITSGNFLFSTSGGRTLNKPDITAADGVSTSVAGTNNLFNTFYGTSAAAPNAAAIAALVKQKVPTISADKLKSALIASAIDIEASGFDRDAGAGIIMAYEAIVAATKPIIKSVSPNLGFGNSGETITLKGTNFNATASKNIVQFGSAKASVLSALDSILTVALPLGASAYAPVTVLNADNGLSGVSPASFLSTFSGKNSFGTSDMAAKVDFTTGANPICVATGDLDGDGKLDMVVANSDPLSTKISVYRNISASGSITSASFSSKVDFTTGTRPESLVIGDLDGDGKPEIVVANGGSASISVLKNTSVSGSITSASFAPKVDFSTFNQCNSVAIGDIDNDGKPDLAVTQIFNNAVSVFRNTSAPGVINAGSFASRVDFATGASPYSVTIGDLDGDKKSEIVVANFSGTSISVLRNTATMGIINTSSMAAKVDFAAGTNPISVAIGDLDGDGKPDLAVSNYGNANASVYRNISTTGAITTASFAARVSFTTGTTPYSIAIGDLNGDSKPDLAVANYNSASVSVLRNTAVSGSLTTASFAAKVDFSTGTNPISLAIADLDGDGKQDLATANYNGPATVSVLRNNQAIAPSVLSFSPASAKAGDLVTLTGNDFNQTAASNTVFFGATRGTVMDATFNSLTVKAPFGATYNAVTVLNSAFGLSGSSTKSFLPTFSGKGSLNVNDILPKVDFAAATTPCSVAMGDLDGDGKTDLVVANYSASTVSVYRNTSVSGAVTASSFAARVDFATGSSPRQVTIGDIDGDGKLDLATANYDANTVSVLRNTSVSGTITTSSFAARVDFATGLSPASLAIGDLDGDGKPDLAATNANNASVSVLRNTSNPGSIISASFAGKVDFATGTTPRSVVIGDLDGDRKPDLAVANNGSNTVSVFRNTSTSGSIASTSFASKVDFAGGLNSFDLAIGDLDGDGKADLSVVNFGDNNVSVLRNISSSGSITTASFATRVNFATGAGAYSVALGDMDGDGKVDLAVLNANGSTVSVFRNISSSGSITTASFAAKVDFATGLLPYELAIGDLDGDGKPDMAVPNNNNVGSVSVFRNNPSPIITFNANGGSGSMVAQTISNNTSAYLTTNSFTRTGYSFGGWNTAANGGGTSYANGGSYTMGDVDVTLFAIWVQAPSITSFTPSSGCPGTLVTITGTNLVPTALTIGGKSAIVVSSTGTSLRALVMPGAVTGSVTLTNAAGTITGSGNFTATATPYPSAQQGNKLVGTGAVGVPGQGRSVSISADGNTALVGGWEDNGGSGAAWVFTRSGGVWAQQGTKLLGSGAVGSSYQGTAVALSADGNTAIVGGYYDDSGTGAAWVFVRSGSTWTQQGAKLVGTGAVGAAYQGWSVSLSADGNTAISGGFSDNSDIGATWVFVRSGGVWIQQGNKLVGTGSIGTSGQGESVSLSADGKTAIIGGSRDDNFSGAVWVFTRTGSTWTQQGDKLVGIDAIGAAEQGAAVAMSADGNTAISGGYGDNNYVGAAWVFTRSGSTWAQQGNKLVDNNAIGDAKIAHSVSLSADGNTAILGGYTDNSGVGATWVFTRNGLAWTQQGSKLVGTGAVGPALQGWALSLSSDGNTALVAGFNDNNNSGAAWVYAVSNTVTYNGNGNTGGIVPAVTTGANATSVSLATNSGLLVKSGFIFAGWNSLANGTGTRYPAGSSFVLAGNVTLYAQWMLPPSFISFTPKSGCTGSLITLNGTGFLGVTAVSIGGTAVQSFTVISDNQITATAGATKGIIQVNNPVGSASSSIGFTQIPSVSAVSSASCGGSALSVSTLGGAGNALNFGTFSRVVNTAFDISPSVFPVLTASAWVNRTGPISTYSAIISNDNGGFDRALMVEQDGTYHIFAGRDIATGIPSTLNSWEFISVTWSASAVTLFKNGVQVFSTSGETISSSIGGISIGTNINANWPFRGIIDQVSVWSTSRTAAQLLTEMNTNLTGIEAGIQLYYKFDEGSGTTTADLSGKGRTGTFIDSPVWTTSSAPTGYTNYLWSPGGETTRTISVNPLITTNYTVQVSNGPGCSLTSAAATVNIAQISGGLASICVGSQTTWTGNGTAVSWISSNPAVATVSAAGLVQGITPGTATITYTSSPSCTATRQVTVNALPAAPSITGTLSFCPGSSTTLTASAGYSSYLWSNGANTQSISVTTAGNFTVSASNANGCAATSASITTSFLAVPATPVISGGSVPFCSFNPTTLTASAGYSSYLWSNGATTQSISVNTSGSFTVAVKNAANNCSTTSASVTTTALAVPTKPVISGNLSICPGASTTLDAGAGYSAYLWSNGATTRTITVTTAGTYYVNVNHSINSCEQVSDFVNTSIATFPATPVISGTLSICPGSSTTLNAGAGYSSYLWSNGATTQSISVTTAGTYSVTVKNAAGCSANSASVTTSLLAAPATPVITGTLSFCSGSSTTLTANAGYSSYLWSNGATTQSISVTTAGTYSVTAKNAAGCSATSASAITSLLAAPATPVISGTLSFCSGSSTTITASAGYSSYLWSNGATTQSISVTTAGTYTVTAKNAAGCSATSASVVTSILAAPATPVISGTLSICSGSSTTLNAGAGYSSYLWSNGATTESISVNTAGTYSVTVKNAAGCSATSASVTTSLSTAPATPLISGTLSFCSGSSTTLTASAGYSSYLWSNGATTQSISVTTAGTYSVTVKNAANCSATSASVLTSFLPSLPATGALSGPAQVCKSSTGIVYTVTAVSGTTSYAWTLPTGATGTSTTNSITLAFSSTFAGGSLCVTPSGSCGAGTQSCLTLSTITAAPAQPVSITGTAAGVCSTATQTYSVAAVSGADSYTWTAPANSSILSGQGNSSIVLQFVAGFTTGTLSVVSKNCFGSSAARTLALSNVTAVPASITGPVSAVCAGSTQTYSTAAISGATIYTWAVPTGAVINSGQGTATISVTFPTPFTSGAVTVKSGTACYTTGTVRSVTVYSAPVAPASITGTAVGVCGGTTQTYTCPASTTGATTYTWTAPTGATINSGQGNTSVSVTFPAGYTSGNMSVTAVNACGTSTARTLAVSAATAQPGVITGTASNLCAGGSFTYSIVAVTGATTYSWTAPPGCTITANTGTSITMTVPSGFTTGTLSVIANNACGASTARTLALIGVPPTPASITGPVSVCASATGLVYSTPVVAGVTTYTWTVPTGAVITAGASSSSITVTWGTVAGSVTVKAGNACGTNATARSLAVARAAGCRGAVNGENEEPEAMSLYPNPASQMATLSFGSAKESDYQIRVINALGQSVYSSEGKASEGANTIELNLEKLSIGLYIVQLVQDGSRQQVNLVKK